MNQQSLHSLTVIRCELKLFLLKFVISICLENVLTAAFNRLLNRVLRSNLIRNVILRLTLFLVTEFVPVVIFLEVTLFFCLLKTTSILLRIT